MKNFSNLLDNLTNEARVLSQTYQFFIGPFMPNMIGQPEISLDILSDDPGACHRKF